MNNRREKAIEKGLIVNDNQSIYLKVLDIYKKAFEEMINKSINLEKYNLLMNTSELYFSESKIIKEKYKTYLNFKYLYLLNAFYVEKLELKDIEILKNKEDIDDDVLEIVKRTYKKIIKKDNVKTITYGDRLEETTVENGTIVFKLTYGKNTKSFDDENQKVLSRKQRKFLEKLIELLETEMKNTFNENCKIWIEKIL